MKLILLWHPICVNMGILIINYRQIVVQEKTALIIDNDQSHGKGVATALKDLFSAVYSTTNPFDAQRMLKQQPVNFVFTEMNLELIEGTELIQMIKKYSAGAAIVIWSASLSIEFEETARELGVRDFFEKPFNLQVFRERILNIM